MKPRVRKVSLIFPTFRYINIYIYVWVYACMYVCMYVCMHACMHACIHVCMYVCREGVKGFILVSLLRD